MELVGVFKANRDAKRAVDNLRAQGIDEKNIIRLTPQSSEQEVANIPTSEGEQPGMGSAIGGVVGGAVGAGAGSLGAIAISALIPGVGTIIAFGIAAGALLGALGGVAVGEKLEDDLNKGIPIDESYVYKDSLKQGRSLVICLFDDEEQESQIRDILMQAGAESVNAAREDWWIGLRDASKEHYHAAEHP
ncbi:MAG: hypothetical protein AB1757_06590 [Acidobacteriota bacterium]